MGGFAFCVDMGGLVHLRESWRRLGGRVSGIHRVLEKEEGSPGQELFIGSVLFKKEKKNACGFAA